MTEPKSRTWISSQTDITRSMSCSTMRIAAALGGELGEQLAERVGLGLVEARGRLVEQQQLGVAGQAAGQLEQPGGAGRDRVGALVGVRRDADPLEQRRRRRPRAGRTRPSEAAVDVVGDPDVLAHGQRAERLQPLEGAAHPAPRPGGAPAAG